MCVCFVAALALVIEATGLREVMDNERLEVAGLHVFRERSDEIARIRTRPCHPSPHLLTLSPPKLHSFFNCVYGSMVKD